MGTDKITISMHQGLSGSFRAIPRAKRERYQSLFTTLLVEGAAYEGFVEEVTEEIAAHARAGTLTAERLMTLIDEAYEDLQDQATIAEVYEEIEREGTVPFDQVKRELGLSAPTR